MSVDKCDKRDKAEVMPFDGGLEKDQCKQMFVRYFIGMFEKGVTNLMYFIRTAYNLNLYFHGFLVRYFLTVRRSSPVISPTLT